MDGGLPGGATLAPMSGGLSRGAHEHRAAASPAPKSITLPDGTSLSYVEHGEPGGVPVVLLHGYTDSWRSFDLVLPHLPRSLRVFAITQRGHGDSGKPAGGYAPRDFARDVAAFMDQFGPERAVIVGHSMGATVAQRFAIDYPDRTVAMVLEDAFLPRPGNEGIRELWQSVSKLDDPVDPAFVHEFQRSTIAQSVPPGVLCWRRSGEPQGAGAGVEGGTRVLSAGPTSSTRSRRLGCRR